MTFTPGGIIGWATFQSPFVFGKRIGGWKAAAPAIAIAGTNLWGGAISQAPKSALRAGENPISSLFSQRAALFSSMSGGKPRSQ